MLRRPTLPLLFALVLLPAAPLLAQTTAPAAAPGPVLPNWEQLSPAQREALLAPLRDRWNGADAGQRQRMLSHGQRWQSMSPEERDKARRGLRRFEHMSPEQREQARALFGQMRTLSPAQRDALRERWSQMTPEERKDWVRENPPPAKPR
ncbi:MULTISPECIES: DUF3106 domain-containing protein [Stenotrophomonas]|uniref:DUF3106 domain-containing protein n=1 Tax=Stenotrophomonas TaxID=40323 RepID=UPI000D542974|nr:MULTISPECIES: DUF3106 domain-containing protein [Stenotrophomonas]AWH44994.1 hypothetical protein C1926_08105 [Stenotrophomonas sp. ZAC14A_NAIMI4_1]MBK0055583.1 DUF3106 domain-containing protein [Stenotrophomonas sp. S39]